jgi:hypothetical protein
MGRHFDAVRIATMTTMKRIISQVKPAMPLSKLVCARYPESFSAIEPK